MIHTYLDKLDNGRKFGALICDFTDLSTLKNFPVPDFNRGPAQESASDEKWQRDGRSTWRNGISSRRDAERLLDSGWREGTERGTKLSMELDGCIPAVESIRRRPKWGDDGDELDIDRALRGDWDTAYLSTAKLRGNGSKIVTLIGAYGGNCNLNAEELFWNGIQIAVTADILENAGYQCEVIGVWNGAHGDDIGLTGIVAKRAGDPMRIDQLASTFSHAGIFRTIGFEAIVRLPVQTTSSLGRSQNSVAAITQSVRKLEALGVLDAGSVVVAEAYTQRDAVESIKATLHAVTGELPVAA